MMEDTGGDEKRRRMSCGLFCSCPTNIKATIDTVVELGYHFILTQISHPNYSRNIKDESTPRAIGRTDRVLRSNDWTRLVVGVLNSSVDLDSEIDHIRENSHALFQQELGMFCK